MRQPTPTIKAHHGTVGPIVNSHEVTRRRRISPITKTVIASLVFAGAYAAFQRIGTTANAGLVEYTQNLAGGFLAIGITEDQPGFITLSALDRDEVEIQADQSSNRLAGTYTVVKVQTPLVTTCTRLRGPQVMLVTKHGNVEEFDVDWTVEEFNTLREAADCSFDIAIKKKRCGAPFSDLQEALAMWPRKRVPDRVRSFLEPYRSHRTHR